MNMSVGAEVLTQSKKKVHKLEIHVVLNISVKTGMFASGSKEHFLSNVAAKYWYFILCFMNSRLHNHQTYYRRSFHWS